MSSRSWFSRGLLSWYRANKRPLPWRETTDPYTIWLSEVILQQTRVDQGLAYWERFMERYPTVRDLAAASEDEVLRQWQGLGYYSRARNLRQAAGQVMNDHGGRFPSTYTELKALKGVGEYTAAAIGSICFGLPEPVVDGNVYRVLARAFGIGTPIDSTEGRREFRKLAAELLDPRSPGDHNQAVMELGATICTPKKPLCGDCPIARKCVALKSDLISDLPVKAGRAKTRTRHFNYLHVNTKGGLYLRKRTAKDIWQGLYELPLIESDNGRTKRQFTSDLVREFGAGWRVVGEHGPVKHVLSHQVIQAVFWRVEIPAKAKLPEDWEKVMEAEVGERALPRLVERYFEEVG
ncbi:MAG: A/G-specific adenine glycosylase [Flavobacteriales bacterium]|nr:A/G-specific adenine glycosylase [Flavobacteriales bacterium]MCC6938424.1 A/G-specific adenine glycosylase [Flavobacteriales bacterium]